MSSKADRLTRLARAQGNLVKVLEMQVLKAEQRSLALTTEGRELDAMAVKAVTEQPSLIPKLLRCLSDAESNAKQARSAVDTLRQRLLLAKFREEAISGRAMILKEAQERKATEVDTLETALLIGAKASGKRDVLI